MATITVSVTQIRASIRDAYPSMYTESMLSIVRSIDTTDERDRIDELIEQLDVCLDDFAEAYVDTVCR